MMRHALIASIFFLVAALSGCGKSDPPPPPPASDAARSSAPVKNVESLPSGTIREGARTMNTGAELGSTLEQQKQERDKEIESEAK
ncbi:MAG: hypothetical protein ACREVT_02585 [Burkholderiales bacterium]